MKKKISSIEEIKDPKAKVTKYKELLKSLIDSKKVSDINTLIEHVASEETPLVVSRPILTTFSTSLNDLDSETHKEIAEFTLSALDSRDVAFEEQVSTIRENLATIYEEEEDWRRAATILKSIPLEGGRVLSPDYKAGIYIKIARLYLEDDNSFVEGEVYINKAAAIIHEVKDNMLTQLYKASFARILDFKRKYLEASLRYYELSQLDIGEDSREESLDSSCICAILAPAGPQRSRLLATLYKDERTDKLGTYQILEKMFMDRILRKKEIDTFKGLIKEHHRAAKLADGRTTILQRAIREHNLLAASRVYNNVTFDELAILLDIRPQEAEKIASKMISEERLKGSIDQLQRLIHFQRTTSSGVLTTWDSHIQGCCSTVNSILENLEEKHADFVQNVLS